MAVKEPAHEPLAARSSQIVFCSGTQPSAARTVAVPHRQTHSNRRGGPEQLRLCVVDGAANWQVRSSRSGQLTHACDMLCDVCTCVYVCVHCRVYGSSV